MVETARRKFPRCPYLQPICLTFLSQSVMVEGEEIGEGGLSFLSDVEIPEGSQVVLNFFISNGLFFCLRGTIRNQSDSSTGQNTTTALSQKKLKTETFVFRYGVNFNEVNITLKRQIRSFVARSSHTLKNQKISGSVPNTPNSVSTTNR
jgi:hypothetical protein